MFIRYLCFWEVRNSCPPWSFEVRRTRNVRIHEAPSRIICSFESSKTSYICFSAFCESFSYLWPRLMRTRLITGMTVIWSLKQTTMGLNTQFTHISAWWISILMKFPPMKISKFQRFLNLPNSSSPRLDMSHFLTGLNIDVPVHFFLSENCTVHFVFELFKTAKKVNCSKYILGKPGWSVQGPVVDWGPGNGPNRPSLTNWADWGHSEPQMETSIVFVFRCPRGVHCLFVLKSKWICGERAWDIYMCKV